MSSQETMTNPFILFPALQYAYDQNLITLIDRLSIPILNYFQDQHEAACLAYSNQKNTNNKSHSSSSSSSSFSSSSLDYIEKHMNSILWKPNELYDMFQKRFVLLEPVVSELTFIAHHLISCLKYVPPANHELAPTQKANVNQFLTNLMQDLKVQLGRCNYLFEEDESVGAELKSNNREQILSIISRAIRLRVRNAGTSVFLACQWGWRNELIVALDNINLHDAVSSSNNVAEAIYQSNLLIENRFQRQEQLQKEEIKLKQENNKINDSNNNNNKNEQEQELKQEQQKEQEEQQQKTQEKLSEIQKQLQQQQQQHLNQQQQQLEEYKKHERERQKKEHLKKEEEETLKAVTAAKLIQEEQKYQQQRTIDMAIQKNTANQVEKLKELNNITEGIADEFHTLQQNVNQIHKQSKEDGLKHYEINKLSNDLLQSLNSQHEEIVQLLTDSYQSQKQHSEILNKSIQELRAERIKASQIPPPLAPQPPQILTPSVDPKQITMLLQSMHLQMEEQKHFRQSLIELLKQPVIVTLPVNSSSSSLSLNSLNSNINSSNNTNYLSTPNISSVIPKLVRKPASAYRSINNNNNNNNNELDVPSSSSIPNSLSFSNNNNNNNNENSHNIDKSSFHSYSPHAPPSTRRSSVMVSSDVDVSQPGALFPRPTKLLNESNINNINNNNNNINTNIQTLNDPLERLHVITSYTESINQNNEKEEKQEENQQEQQQENFKQQEEEKNNNQYNSREHYSHNSNSNNEDLQDEKEGDHESIENELNLSLNESLSSLHS